MIKEKTEFRWAMENYHIKDVMFPILYRFLHHILELNLILFFLKNDGSQTIDKLTNRIRNAREYDSKASF